MSSQESEEETVHGNTIGNNRSVAKIKEHSACLITYCVHLFYEYKYNNIPSVMSGEGTRMNADFTPILFEVERLFMIDSRIKKSVFKIEKYKSDAMMKILSKREVSKAK